MEPITQGAVFLDFAKARFINMNGTVATFAETIESGLHDNNRQEGEGSDHSRFGADPYQGSNNEFTKNRDAENRQKAYLQKVKAQLNGYRDILIFGPGQAKKELHNLLVDDVHFKTKKVNVQTCDYLTDNQLLEFVRKHFER